MLEQNYGYNLPAKMREALGYKVKSVSDHNHKELSAGEVLHIFEDTFLNKSKPLSVVEAHFAQVNGITATVTLDLNGQRKVVTSVGNLGCRHRYRYYRGRYPCTGQRDQQ